MNDITLDLIKTEFRVDSRLLAPALDHRHRTILENIDKYRSQFEALGNLPFKTERLKTERLGYRDHRYALLNEDQCYFLMTLMRNNNHIVAASLRSRTYHRDPKTKPPSRRMQKAGRAR